MLSEAKFNAIVAMIKGGATDEIIMASQGINEKTLRNIKKVTEIMKNTARFMGK